MTEPEARQAAARAVRDWRSGRAARFTMVDGSSGVRAGMISVLRMGPPEVALIGYGVLLGPIAGIMVVDYFVVRRQHYDLPGLYLAFAVSLFGLVGLFERSPNPRPRADGAGTGAARRLGVRNDVDRPPRARAQARQRGLRSGRVTGGFRA